MVTIIENLWRVTVRASVRSRYTLSTDVSRVTDRTRLVLTADDASNRVRLYDMFAVYCADEIEFPRGVYLGFVVAISLACVVSGNARNGVGTLKSKSLNESTGAATESEHMTKERTRRKPSRRLLACSPACVGPLRYHSRVPFGTARAALCQSRGQWKRDAGAPIMDWVETSLCCLRGELSHFFRPSAFSKHFNPAEGLGCYFFQPLVRNYALDQNGFAHISAHGCSLYCSWTVIF